MPACEGRYLGAYFDEIGFVVRAIENVSD